ncbi:YciI family protein [Erythrobacter sp. T5W1-R]|uniref:YciI family protein n=1 Tax=Erythrobacter sp. T5W1-R TaxID=3101752 RepID=UPI002AFF2C1D|nr:YciI family protein [Erythrobacter sp. T5W1-R]MEA1618454.1 YciI family protein [Erythrobacter sp. T5W1-R]
MRMFCFHCRDGEDGGKLRAVHREAHLKFLADNASDFVLAGPLKRADGLIIGSLLIVKGRDEAEARARLENDPYLTGGVWQSIRVDEFSPLLGDWVYGMAKPGG